MGAGTVAEDRDVTVYWRPYHEVYPEFDPDQDFLAFDEATAESIGQVCLEHHSAYRGHWRWSMYARSNTGRVPFEIHGHEDSRGDAGRRVVEAYKLLLAHNERHPRKSPARS